MLEDVLSFLRELGISLNAEDVIRDLDEDEIFVQVPSSAYEPIRKEITINGEVVGEINSGVFRGEVAVQRSIAHARAVQSEVLEQTDRFAFLCWRGFVYFRNLPMLKELVLHLCRNDREQEGEHG